MLEGKKLLITGGTGSFGKAVLEKFSNSSIREIVVYSRDEKKQDDLRQLYSNEKVKFVIGDVRSYESVVDALVGVDYVYHAAALKQVPSCEFYPMEAVKTNIIGTENVLSAAIQTGVKKVICLSTDKAAYPINAMGISKAMMEKISVAKSRVGVERGTLICATRYGNVMASRGSVIPRFIKQILAGEKCTVTNPQMTRFMMTLDEAVNLVEFAFKYGEPGDTFIQKAPASTIRDLVSALSIIFNIERGYSIIGTRHGEKLYETLMTSEEKGVALDLGEYYKIPADNRDLNYEMYEKMGTHSVSESDYNSHNTYRMTVDELVAKLKSLDLIENALKIQD